MTAGEDTSQLLVGGKSFAGSPPNQDCGLGRVPHSPPPPFFNESLFHLVLLVSIYHCS